MRPCRVCGYDALAFHHLSPTHRGYHRYAAEYSLVECLAWFALTLLVLLAGFSAVILSTGWGPLIP